MATEIEIHPIQGKILNVLRFRKEARFSELNIDKISTDHFTFHINQLVYQGLIRKTSNNKYELTNKGKEFVNRLDIENGAAYKQGKIAVLVVCVDESTGEKKYLVQQRLRQPYYGFYGFIGGLVKWGETVSNAAERLLFEQSGLKARLAFIGIKHNIDHSANGELLEDKYYFVFRAEHTTGQLVSEVKGGKNLWVRRNEIKKLPNLLSGIDIVFNLLTKEALHFSEQKHIEEKY